MDSPAPSRAETDHQAHQAAAEDVRVAASIDNWKRKLLDVSKRNRALNFRPSKTTTLVIVDEHPAEVFRSLYNRRRTMRFQAALDKKAAPSNSEDGTTESGEAIAGDSSGDGMELPASAHYVPYEAAELDSRHTDDVLQTRVVKDVLDRMLRRIEAQARESLEEQGVNTLFLACGMLEYGESGASSGVLRAPLVLVPVELSRSTARAAYTVRATDEDPLVNPALAEYLSRSFGLALPELSGGAEGGDDVDLQQFLAAVRELIRDQEGWQVKTDIVLAFFSFQKFVMFKDLEANAASFQAHPLIRQIVLRSGGSIRSLPDDVREAELDREFTPEATSLVTDADGSQLRAILAASKGHSLVLEGPPGTGKSQTITNLIAQALAESKSVLFVAEKMAALNVVHTRLVQAGLAEFCLELHSTKANKRAVMREVGASLDASLQRPQVLGRSTSRLTAVRNELSAYTQAVHQPYGELGWTPYQAYGHMESLRGAKKVRLSVGVLHLTADQLNELDRRLDSLAQVAETIDTPSTHPWRDTRQTFYSEADLEGVGGLLASLLTTLTRVGSLASEIQDEFSFPPVHTLADVHTAISLAAVLGRSPGAPLAVLESEVWNSPPPDAVELIKQGRDVQRQAAEVAERFTDDVFLKRHADDIVHIEAKEHSRFGFLNALDGRYREIRSRWLTYRRTGYEWTLLQQAARLREVDLLTDAREALRARDAIGSDLFDPLWRGEESDWDALDAYIGWVVEFRKMCVGHGLKEQALRTASTPAPDVSLVATLRTEATRLWSDLAALRKLVAWPDDYLQDAAFDEMTRRLEAMLDTMRLAPRWATFASAYASVEGTAAQELLPMALSGELSFPDLAPAFRRAVLQKWLAEVVQQRESLRSFHTLTHEQRIAEFRRLDAELLLNNRSSLVAKLRDRVQSGLREPKAATGLSFLRRQLTLQRNLAPLRVTMQQAGAAIRKIKPIFMMSPLSVSQLLDGSSPPFDLVIFDEASQMPAEDAVGAIVRGKQLVVVGDPKQLPPTNFFSVVSGTVDAPLGEDGLPLFEDSESILEEFAGSGAAITRLRWHYRSLHEALIHFSNVSFYDSELFTFPSVQTDSHGNGLSFEFVSEGVYEGKGLNQAEARRVSDAVVQHARQFPEVSLAVGTFNMRQQVAIQDELEVRRREDPSLEPFFASRRDEPFFVKNLENIQGDERDVIFLSVTYGRDSSGLLRYNFGPLNGENGWRRLNVLTTRARRQMRVFSSIRGDDINPAQTTSQGPQLLRDFLQFAEFGQLDSSVASGAGETESPFEREVYLELTRRGINLRPQVGVGGYRIDFAVMDDEVPDRFVCGIECDGVAYHASESARDRDRLRQQVLEARGWTIHRLWSTDWFKDRDGQIERLSRLVAETRERRRQAISEIDEASSDGACSSIEAVDPALATSDGPAALLPPVAAGAGEGLPPPSIEASPVAADVSDSRRSAKPYEFAPTPELYGGQDFLEASWTDIQRGITEVLAVEAPLHVSDLALRVTARWGARRVGSRMMRHFREVLHGAAARRLVFIVGDFVFIDEDEDVEPRSRQGTGIPVDRIAPDEVREAVCMSLEPGPLDRRRLVNEVRALFGFNRTGASLERCINSAVEALLAEGVLGEASTGLCLREGAEDPSS